MPARAKSTIRLRLLGATLRQLRDMKDLTTDEVGKEIGRHGSSISRTENGLVAIQEKELEALLDLYEVAAGGARDAILNLGRESRRRGWWTAYRDVLSEHYQDFISLEDEATGIQDFQTHLIPGLLQTPAYCRTVIEAIPRAWAPRQVESLVKVRTARQKVLERSERPLRFSAIVSEGVLRQQVGGPEVMREQLDHLVEATERDNVALRVLPYSAGAHAAMNGPFILLEFKPIDLEVVLVENLTSSLYLEQEAEVSRYFLVFDRLRDSTLSIDDSRAYIKKLAKEI